MLLNLNVNSLNAHSPDIDADYIIKYCHYLALNETWQKPEQDQILQSFVKITGVNNSTAKNCAGGVALYMNKNVVASYEVINTNSYDTDVGDICAVQIGGKYNLIIASVYIYNNKSEKNILDLINVFVSNIDKDVPLIICGDFNYDILKNRSLLVSAKQLFDLDCINSKPTTQRYTCLDLSLFRNINMELMEFVAYFTDHRPVLNKIMFPSDDDSL